MFKHTLIKRLLVTGLTIGAASFPAAAQATFIEGGGGGSSSPTQATQVASAPARPQTSANAQSGFQWGDTGIGAASALILIGVGSGAAVAVRRRTGALAG